MIGPILNSSAVLFGGLVGASLSKHLPERLNQALPMTFGCASLGIGVAMIMKIQQIPAVILALLFGAVLGELINLEQRIAQLSLRLKNRLEKPSANPNAPPSTHERFIEQYVALLVLFCAGGMGVFGSLNEGMTGDPSLLITKSFLDFFCSMIFAASLGYSVSFIALPQLIIQFGLLLIASLIQPLITPMMLADFSACGGILMLAIGLRICGIKSFPVMNMLFSLLFVMPVSALWLHYFV